MTKGEEILRKMTYVLNI